MARGLTDHIQAEEEKTTIQDRPDSDLALPPPKGLKRTDWAERIDRAKRARAFGRKLRKGKPKTFRTIPGLGSRSSRHHHHGR